MKGFNTSDGYMGLVEGRYILFASESGYYEYMNDQSEGRKRNVFTRISSGGNCLLDILHDL